MKTEKPLNNKERRRLGSAIRKKLIEMGVKDTIIMKATQKVKNMAVIENGQIAIKRVASLQAHNLNRTMTKRFLAMTRGEIFQFLSTSFEQIQAAAKKLEEKESPATEAIKKAAE